MPEVFQSPYDQAQSHTACIGRKINQRKVTRPFVYFTLEKVLRAWMSDGNDEAIVVKAFNDIVFKKSLMTLADGLWLGDEVGLSRDSLCTSLRKLNSYPVERGSRYLLDSMILSFCHETRACFFASQVLNLYMKILLQRNREATAAGKPVPK